MSTRHSLTELNTKLMAQATENRVVWALKALPGEHILSSSFGAQSAVLLHMTTQQRPDIPVVVIDTGYLFPETYQFIDALTERLSLNLKVFQAEDSTGRFEARYGRLWEQGLEGIEHYNQLRKVAPLKRAFEVLKVSTWLTGLRRQQASSRSQIEPLERLDGRWKVYPLFDWTDQDVFKYLTKHDLPYHPLWEKGYVSIGDWHSTRTLADAGSEEATRFNGLKRECGLHDPKTMSQAG
jgi:phosphoadenosine phosphosulfate reductase